MRHVRGEDDQNNTFSEIILCGALKGAGNGNAGGQVYKGLLPSFLAPPSSQRTDMPLPTHGALYVCWPTLCVRWLRSGPKTVVKSTSAFACFGTNRLSANRPGALSRLVFFRKGAKIICSPG